MPRIEDQILDSVVYLYPSVEEAKAGVSYGGAGFLVQILTEVVTEPPTSGGPLYTLFRYAVTNRHVIDGGNTVIRVNTQDGKTDEIPLARNQWTHHPGGDDLSVAQISGLEIPFHKVRFVPEEFLLTKSLVEDLNIGPGDDVYMVGRFIAHDGRQRNQPFVQSGIISLMPTEVENEHGGTEELFAVEMRSLSGCSGSPVFFDLPNPPPANRIRPEHKELAKQARWLLGIDCGHFPTYEQVYEVEKRGGEKIRRPTRYEAKMNAGQMTVIPAWKLRELLDHPRLVMAREEVKKKAMEKLADRPIVRDSAAPEADLITKEGFEEALRRSSRKTSSEPESEKNET